MNTMSSHYDQALATVHQYGPATTEGFFNHNAMVIEAISSLGFERKLPQWLQGEFENALTRTGIKQKITLDNWQQALSDKSRFDDWVLYFKQQFTEQGWQTSLNHWCGIFAKGFISSAAHGVIRTAHAYRALSRLDNAIRQQELAHALASWAVGYRELPVQSQPGLGKLNAKQALAEIATVPSEQQVGEGFITAGYETIKFAPNFSKQVAAINMSGDLDALADDITVAFAELFIQASHSPFTTIVFAHAITGATAAFNLLPALDKHNARDLLFRAWEAGCALKAAFQDQPFQAIKPAQYPLIPEQLAAAAIKHGDDHVIKVTEACLSCYQRSNKDVLLQAANFIQQQL